MNAKSFLLENQCQLTWTEYGAPDGEPIFYFHGIPGSRLEAKPADNIARDLGIRLIALDRPGYGDSDIQDNFKPLDLPRLLVQLADKLNISRFSILGYSGGGIYALACAHEIPERIKLVTLIGCPAPFETEVMKNSINADVIPLYELAAADFNAAIMQVSQLALSPETLMNNLMAALPAEDIEIINDKQIRAQYLDNLTLAINKGVNGFVGDLRCFALPWQFKLQDIQTNIDIWHGRNDKTIGFAAAEYLTEMLKNTSTHYLDNKGHLFLFHQWVEILESLKRKAI